MNSLRCYATAAVKAAVPVPIRLFNLEGRYATALFTASVRKNILNDVEGELLRIKQYAAKNPKIHEYLQHPIANRRENLKVVTSLLAQGKYSDITHNFFQVLCENGRLNYTQRVIDSFISLMKAQRGEVQATITTAYEMPAETLEKIKSVLNRGFLVGNTRSLDVRTKINPDILGGMIVEVGDRSIDLSVANKMKRLNMALEESI